jgi:hypothetical protein
VGECLVLSLHGGRTGVSYGSMGVGASPHHKRALALALAVGTIVACTVWNDATVGPQPGQDAAPDNIVADSPSPPPDQVSSDASSDVDAGSLPPGYLSFEDAARLCALSFACDQINISVAISLAVNIDSLNFSLCMDWAAGPLPPDHQGIAIQQQVLQCVAQAQSCIAAGECLPLEDLDPGDPRCVGSDGGEYCVGDAGDTKLNCGQTPFAQHCNNGQLTPGQSCHQGFAADGGPNGLHWCSLTPAGVNCPATPSTCMGSIEDYCGIPDELHSRYNCQTVGSTCGINDAGFLQCGSFPCTTVGPSCAGDNVVVCDGNEGAPFNCAALGGTCSSKGNFFRCTRPSDACDSTDSDINQCGDAGDTISLCIGGQKTSFDCSSIGKKCLKGTLPQTDHCG